MEIGKDGNKNHENLTMVVSITTVVVSNRLIAELRLFNKRDNTQMNVHKFKIGLLVFSVVSSQRLSSKCENDMLILEIPYPDQHTANLLYLQAGTCDENNYGGSFRYDDQSLIATLEIPIEECDLKDELYGS